MTSFVSIRFPDGTSYAAPSAMDLYKFLLEHDLVPPESLPQFRRLNHCAPPREESVLLWDNQIGVITKGGID